MDSVLLISLISEGRGFDSRSLEFIYIILPTALWPWGRVRLHKWVPGIFRGGKSGRCVGLTTLPSSCADCLEIWEPHPPRTLRACPGLYWASDKGLFYLYLYHCIIWATLSTENCWKYLFGDWGYHEKQRVESLVLCRVINKFISVLPTCTLSDMAEIRYKRSEHNTGKLYGFAQIGRAKAFLYIRAQ